MYSFLAWYLTVSLLGWLSFPLAYRLLPGLKDRGYSLARTLGLLIWGYCFWMLASLGIVQNDTGGLVLAAIIVVGLAAFALQGEKGILEIRSWLKAQLRLVLVIEVLFGLAFVAWTVVRAANPEIIGTEKPMELAFINAILRSPGFPPRDPWLSGYAISYYYFGYVITAMLAKITSTAGSVAFNLMLALVFALSGSGAYGVVYNLFAARQAKALSRNRREAQPARSSLLALPFLGPLFLLIVSNVEGFLEALHQRGWFWPSDPSGWNFWLWLDIPELRDPPPFSPAWIPERHWWWWRASRVVQDYGLAGGFREVIDEFPFFSYLLGDLHPHVLAMPFGLLAISLALNYYLDRQRGEIHLLGFRILLTWKSIFFAALVLGGLAFLNTWDFPIALTLLCGALLVARIQEDGWRFGRLEEFLSTATVVAVLSILLYLPFYISFSSQAGGILPNLESPTRGVHLWIMFATLFLPMFAFLLYLGRGRQWKWSNLLWGIGLTLGLVLVLVVMAKGAEAVVREINPEAGSSYLAVQELLGQDFFSAVMQRRWEYAGGLLTLVLLLAWTLVHLSRMRRVDAGKEGGHPAENPPSPVNFVLLLILLGALLVIAPEFIYLRDQFGTRMNTIFKFYYQAWLLWSMAAAYGVGLMLQSLRRGWWWLYTVGLGFLMLIALTYPILGLIDKTYRFNPPTGWTLDGAAYLTGGNPGDAAAIAWLMTAPDGVIAESTRVDASYKYWGRMATHTGLPTVLGWPGHEGQWRGGYLEQGSRNDDLRRLYETRSWDEAVLILNMYNIRYLIVGDLERQTYRVEDAKFELFLQQVFDYGGTTIYLVP